MDFLNKTVLTILVVIGLTIGIDTMGQPPGPPADGHGQSDDQMGGDTPIGGGVLIFMGLAAAYGGKKLFDLKKQSVKE